MLGVEQINTALSQMDEVTQQNSALVEENAATAKTLEQQSSLMDQRMSFFRVDEDAKAGNQRGRGDNASRAVAALRSMAARGRAPRQSVQTHGNLAMKQEPEWQEF